MTAPLPSSSAAAAPISQDELKAQVGRAALAYVVKGEIVGVGTGSTVNKFIDALATIKDQIRGAVSSSIASTERLRALGIQVFDSNEVEELGVYIDGADEIDPRGFMVKGGGAALTREKIIAAQSRRFVCIADASKLVDTLGAFPLPVEVIPMAARRVMRQFAALGGHALDVAAQLDLLGEQGGAGLAVGRAVVGVRPARGGGEFGGGFQGGHRCLLSEVGQAGRRRWHIGPFPTGRRCRFGPETPVRSSLRAGRIL